MSTTALFTGDSGNNTFPEDSGNGTYYSKGGADTIFGHFESVCFLRAASFPDQIVAS